MGFLKGLFTGTTGSRGGNNKDDLLSRYIKITDDIFQVGGGGLTAPADAAIYLVGCGEQAALVDAGTGKGEDKLMDNVRAAGVDPQSIEYLLITHCHFDHTGGAAALRERLQCTTVGHEADARFLEEGNSLVTAAMWYGATIRSCPVDRKLSASREELQIGDRTITAVHTPGHSPGSVVYMTASQGQSVVFAQDVHGPLDPNFRSNARDYQESLRRLMALEPDILCEGHFGVFKGKDAAKEFIQQFIED